MLDQHDTRFAPPSLARAGVRDTARILGGVLAPVVAEGVVARRKSTVRMGGRLNIHGRAARILNDMRSRYDADALTALRAISTAWSRSAAGPAYVRDVHPSPRSCPRRLLIRLRLVGAY